MVECLSTLGRKPKEVASAITKFPPILSHSVEEKLCPLLAFFQALAEISSNVALAQSQPSSDYNPWSDFAQNVSGEWDGFGADFSREGKPIELSVVPEAYREWEVKVFDWQTQCPTLAQPDDAATRYCIDERSIGSALAYSYSFTGSYVAVWPLGKNNSNQLEVEHCLINPNDKVSRVRVINLAETEVLLGWSLQDGDQLVALPLPLHLPQQLEL
ncbi:hypothetical protein ISN45_Aa07g040930 [Arabidopsis thaliana x Arabidopsis arenosa]|uniref:Uncharacterized protein n=1 Tax=Arabidopsis thaliana x Arabidopsis arenosa TaxID=1240361 RepID=A0A8T1YE60_9BRAS|nr:hypothetical protein ISN45_Aa07g040930 [Arabidopsis thaliana x Arabidopsis arenosa]